MEYNEFIRRKDAYNSFKELRKILNGSISNPKEWKKSFKDMFAEVGALAMENNCIAQDVLSYYYKDGVEGVIEENYDQYMQWEILAGANGNEFAIEKLQFFLNYAIQEIAEGAGFREASPVQPLERLPESYKGIHNGHNGTHHFLIDYM